MLDYGCASGNLLEKLKQYRPDVELYGRDIIDLMPQERKGVFHFSLIDSTNFDRLPYEDNSFDLVMFQNVLEHLSDPNLMFSEAFRVLKPGEWILCEVPSPRCIFMPSLQWVLGFGKDQAKTTMNFYDDPTHIRPYTGQSPLRLSTLNGFINIKTYKARNFLYLLGLPLHLISAIKRMIAALVYWWDQVHGGANGVITSKPKERN